MEMEIPQALACGLQWTAGQLFIVFQNILLQKKIAVLC